MPPPSKFAHVVYQTHRFEEMVFQIDLLDMKAADEFMRGPAFAANPVGEPFDPEELAARSALLARRLIAAGREGFVAGARADSIPPVTNLR